jgi:nicotinamide-nucleotide amidase
VKNHTPSYLLGKAMTLPIDQLATELGNCLKKRNWQLVTAESCTGGGLAYALTNIAGSSAWFDRGLITYSNAAKQDLLSVKAATLESFGAVSAETAREMANGALQSGGQVSLAITGIAGPTGGTIEKPVGTVWFGFACTKWETQTTKQIFSGNRLEIRSAAIQFALLHLLDLMQVT